MRLLLTGASGMLGLDVLRAGRRAGHELVGLTHAELDISDEGAVQEAFWRVRPDAALNCAAWTDVDGAEIHRDEAYAVNAAGPAHLAAAAGTGGTPLMHLSTDYVFAGEPPRGPDGRPRAYIESDPTGPRSVYGETKLTGETHVLDASPRNAVVRASWLFGTGGRNFADTMLGLAAEQDTVRVVCDQVGCPTWTGHLAPALIGLLERQVGGLVHLAGGGHVSWNGFAKEIFRQAEIACRVQEASTSELARPAQRPAWSVLESEREDILPLPPWQDGLAGYLAARAGMMRT